MIRYLYYCAPPQHHYSKRKSKVLISCTTFEFKLLNLRVQIHGIEIIDNYIQIHKSTNPWNRNN